MRPSIFLAAFLAAALLFRASMHCCSGGFRHHRLSASNTTATTTAALGPSGGVPSDTCEHVDCPSFAVVHEDADRAFEIRRYNASVWAETDDLLEASFDKAGTEGFYRLFGYIQGKNNGSVSIPMTAPVLTSLKPSAGPFHSPSYAVKFFVPPAFSPQPPAPAVGTGVHIAQFPSRCVAVRRFSGFATDLNIGVEAKALADSLEGTAWANLAALSLADVDRGWSVSEAARGESYSIAQYNSPFELFNRVNEVWVPFASEDEGCTPAPAAHAVAAAAATAAAAAGAGAAMADGARVMLAP